MLVLRNTTGPHTGEKIIYAGEPVDRAARAMILMHGRGAYAESMQGFIDELRAGRMVFIIPQAENLTWYPHRFIEKRKVNEPDLSSALQLIDAIVTALSSGNISRENIYLLGFSQGACLAADYAARFPARYGGIFILSGGLIGDRLDPSDYSGDLRQTPVFLGCSDMDFHIPEARVHESAGIFRQLNASVTEKIYPGLGHSVSREEIEIVKDILSTAVFVR
jgi:phospholipase/carboxylesterase